MEHCVRRGLPQQGTSTDQHVAQHDNVLRGAVPYDVSNCMLRACAELMLQSTLEPLLHVLRSKVAGKTQ